MRKLFIFLMLFPAQAYSATICDDPIFAPKIAKCVGHLPAATVIPPDLLKPNLTKGIRIEADVSGTIYQTMGLQKNDVITQINGRDFSEVMANGNGFLRQFGKSSALELKVYRPDAAGGQTLDYIANSESMQIGWKNNPKDLVSGNLEGNEGKDLIEGILIGIIHSVIDGPKIEKNSEGRPVRVIELPDMPTRGGQEPREPRPETPEAPTQPDAPSEPDTPSDDDGNPPQDEPETPDNGDDDDSNDDDGGSPTPEDDDDFLPADPDGTGNMDDTGRSKRKRSRDVFRVVEKVGTIWMDPNRNPDNLKLPKPFDETSGGRGKIKFQNRLDPLINPNRLKGIR